MSERAQHPFWVAGEWRRTSQAVGVINPYTGDEIAQVCYAGEEDIEEAVKTAHRAFQRYRQWPAYRRAEVLFRIAEGIRRRRDELARTIMQEAGKPIRYAYAEVDRAYQTFSFSAEAARNLSGESFSLDVTPQAEGYWGVTRRFPIGLIVGITPFNFPLNLVAHKVGPALASGNVILLKPAPQTPLTALLLAEIALEAGLDPEAFQVIPCSVPLAQRLATHPDVEMVSFTGSAQVGWRLKELNPNKRVVLELGGNAAMVVDDSGNYERALKRGISGAFAYAGQVCISVQRIFVHRSLYEDFLEDFVRHAQAVKVGDPADEETVVGPMISTDAALRIENWVKEAAKDGASILTGGRREGRVFYPTVLTGTNPQMKVWKEEVFAPVVLIEPFDEFEQALAMVNDSVYGLQAGVFTSRVAHMELAFRRLRVGAVIINDYPTFRVDPMPYGGVKRSGWGREGIRYAIEEMTESRLLVVNPDVKQKEE